MVGGTNMNTNQEKLSMKEIIIAIIVSLIVLAVCAFGDTMAYGQEYLITKDSVFMRLDTPKVKKPSAEPLATGIKYPDKAGNLHYLFIGPKGGVYYLDQTTGKKVYINTLDADAIRQRFGIVKASK